MKDVLIIGQGIAGSFLGWELIKRGKRICVVDEDHKDASSLVSAGVINPITGMRLALVPHFDTYFTYAKKEYRALERELAQTFFEEKAILRMFKNTDEREHWQRKEEAGLGEGLIERRFPPQHYYPTLNDELGSVLITRAGHAHPASLMRAFREYFRNKKVLVNVRFNYDDLKIDKNRIRYRSESFKRVVFAEGYQIRHNPFFDWLPTNSVKGEILTVAMDGRNLPDAILNKRHWAAPLGSSGWALGSTYDRDTLDCRPTAKGKKGILRGVKTMFDRPIKVKEHKAGVRPVIEDQQPVVGMHPQLSCIGVFNGLGSKGFLKAPRLAALLADHLCAGTDLPKSVKPARYAPVMN